MTMLEKIARVMNPIPFDPDFIRELPNLAKDERDCLLRDARKIVEAMRGVTDEVAICCEDTNPLDLTPVRCWHAFIDAILTEQTHD